MGGGQCPASRPASLRCDTHILAGSPRAWGPSGDPAPPPVPQHPAGPLPATLCLALGDFYSRDETADATRASHTPACCSPRVATRPSLSSFLAGPLQFCHGRPGQGPCSGNEAPRKPVASAPRRHNPQATQDAFPQDDGQLRTLRSPRALALSPESEQNCPAGQGLQSSALRPPGLSLKVPLGHGCRVAIWLPKGQ